MGLSSIRSRFVDGTSLETSVSIDEAIAMLLGRADGPIRLMAPERVLTAEEQDAYDSWAYSLHEDLEEEHDSLRSAYHQAKDDGLPSNAIAERLHALDRFDTVLEQAEMYRSAIDDELNKGPLSQLRTDKTISDPSYRFITRTSLDEWARERLGISFCSCNGSADKAAKRQESSSGAINTGQGGRQSHKKKERWPAQDAAIVAELERLRYDPTQVPKGKPGRRGLRSQVRAALKHNPLFKGPTVFDKAWDRVPKVPAKAGVEGSPPPK